MKREEAEAIYDQGKEAVVDFILELVNRIEKIESQLKKNSKNSSKPPSTDGFNKPPRTRSQRKKTNKKSGAQKGHKGNTLRMIDNPDIIEELELAICPCCGDSLENSNNNGCEKRQVFEIPPMEVKITEYRSIIKKCSKCGTTSKHAFPDNVTHKTQYGNRLRSIAVYFRNYELIPVERTAEMFNDLFSIPLSEGTIVNATKKISSMLEGFREWVSDRLINSDVVNFDETGININGKLHWLHGASTPLLTYHYTHPKRGSEAIDAMNILPNFTGTAVHDHWKPYFSYKNCSHALCNAHHLRELTFIAEQYNQKWADKMIKFLVDVKNSVEIACKTDDFFESDHIKKFERKYKRILKEGFDLNPPPEQSKIKKRGRPKRGKILALLDRLKKYQKEVLGFMYDFKIPFDNNLAERDIRMMKVQQKISGLFRTKDGADQFNLIRSFISTAKKQNYSILNSIEDIFNGIYIYEEFSL